VSAIQGITATINEINEIAPRLPAPWKNRARPRRDRAQRAAGGSRTGEISSNVAGVQQGPAGDTGAAAHQVPPGIQRVVQAVRDDAGSGRILLSNIKAADQIQDEPFSPFIHARDMAVGWAGSFAARSIFPPVILEVLVRR